MTIGGGLLAIVVANWALREANNIYSYIMFFNSSQYQWISRVPHLSLEPFHLLFRVAGYINFTCRLLSGLFKNWCCPFRALFLRMVRSFENVWFPTTLVCFLALSITILFLISSATLQLVNYAEIGFVRL